MASVSRVAKKIASASAGGVFPMGSSRRRLLNQMTHLRVASSTASKLPQGPRWWMGPPSHLCVEPARCRAPANERFIERASTLRLASQRAWSDLAIQLSCSIEEIFTPNTILATKPPQPPGEPSARGSRSCPHLTTQTISRRKDNALEPPVRVR